MLMVKGKLHSSLSKRSNSNMMGVVDSFLKGILQSEFLFLLAARGMKLDSPENQSIIEPSSNSFRHMISGMVTCAKMGMTIYPGI